MNSTEALREIADMWGFRIVAEDADDPNTEFETVDDSNELFSDLTALISEKQAEYFEFVKWIGFYSTTLYYRDIDEKWLRTRFDIDGIPTEEYDEYTTEQLFEYWKTNEQ